MPFDLAYDGYEFIILGGGDNFQVGTFEVIYMIDKQGRRIIAKQRVKFVLFLWRQHLPVAAKRDIGDAAQIDMSVQHRNKPAAQVRAAGPAVCQRHYIIRNFADIVLSRIDGCRDGSRTACQCQSEKQSRKFPAVKAMVCGVVHNTSERANAQLLCMGHRTPADLIDSWSQQTENILPGPQTVTFA